jgi:ribosome-associated heat shock protein Hsp15
MEPLPELRIDKWLWATRVYKTRSLAIDACKAGHVKVDGQRIKPARNVRIGEVLTARFGEMVRTFKVVGLPAQRVGAALVREHLEDLTPAAEYAKRETQRAGAAGFWPKGRGRPTKRDRRRLDQLLEPPSS